MGINSMSLQSGESNNNVVNQAVVAVFLRCVECAALYPGTGDPPRYRCECGGVLDVEAAFHHPTQQPALQKGYETLTATVSDFTPLAGAHWRQLFYERATLPPTCSTSAATLSPDRTSASRYHNPLPPIPQHIILRPP